MIELTLDTECDPSHALLVTSQRDAAGTRTKYINMGVSAWPVLREGVGRLWRQDGYGHDIVKTAARSWRV
jgi:hypothetical protein